MVLLFYKRHLLVGGRILGVGATSLVLGGSPTAMRAGPRVDIGKYY